MASLKPGDVIEVSEPLGSGFAELFSSRCACVCLRCDATYPVVVPYHHGNPYPKLAHTLQHRVGPPTYR